MWTASSGSINRNIVECKAPYFLTYFDYFIVLIETLWNVKKLREPERWKRGIVLIETLWNVKLQITQKTEIRGNSINRNIVECKGCRTGPQKLSVQY